MSMNRIRMIACLAGLGLALLANLGMAQANRVPFFRSYPVQGQVHMLEAPNFYGNIAVFAGEDGVLLVDTFFDRNVPDLLTAVSTISDKPINYVVNTHIHVDHTGGNNRLAEYGVTILAHDNVRLRMLEELIVPRNGGTRTGFLPAGARPLLTYSDAITFHLNGEEVRVFKAPSAHTDGDSFIYFVDSDVLHLGDVFRTRRWPIVDKFNGGSFTGMIEAMGLAIGLAGPNTKVIPGHGEGFTDRDGMIEYVDLLYELKKRVEAALAEGVSLEEFMASRPTADLDPDWSDDPGWTVVDLLPVIYEELTSMR